MYSSVYCKNMKHLPQIQCFGFIKSSSGRSSVMSIFTLDNALYPFIYNSRILQDKLIIRDLLASVTI